MHLPLLQVSSVSMQASQAGGTNENLILPASNFLEAKK